MGKELAFLAAQKTLSINKLLRLGICRMFNTCPKH